MKLVIVPISHATILPWSCNAIRKSSVAAQCAFQGIGRELEEFEEGLEKDTYK
jgi:hypothetical protein